MKHRYMLLFALLLLPAAFASATTHTITNSGLSFTPSTLTINVGDTVTWNIGGSHNVVEVSQSTWNSNGNTPLTGGFSTPFGGGTVVFTSTGTHYYVCSPHASSGMKGTITVEQKTIRTNSLASSVFCEGESLTVPFTITGTFNSGNVFTAQLSNASGSFANPSAIGTVNGTSSGQISATLPGNVVPGTGYRIRVVSSQPVVIGSDNGTDLEILDQPVAAITPGGPTTFCDGDSVSLVAGTGTGFTYTWRRDGTVISGATTNSHTAKLAGQYTVEISNGSCSSTSAPVTVTVNAADPTMLTWTGTVDSDWSTVGNWDNPCAVPSAGDTVVIGPGTTPPAGNAAVSLARLVINNGSGLSLSNNLEITGSLVLIAGKVTLGSAHLTIASSGQISGGSANSHVVTDGTGELRQAGLGSGGKTTPVLFPVGSSSSSYTPVTLTNGGTQDEYAVIVSDDVLSGGASGTPLSIDVVGKTWFITEGTAGGSNANLQFQWNTADELPSFDASACFAAHHDGSDWTPLQNPGAASGGATPQRIVTGVSVFSPFAIGDASSPLPVEYRTLSADVSGETVSIRWETEQEISSAGFEILRSRSQDGPWKRLHFLPGSGSERRGASYSYRDTPPGNGDWVYRLRQIDLDGTAALSPMLRVAVSARPRALAIESAYPQPIRLSSGGDVTVRFTAAQSGRAVLTLHNLLGERVARVYDAAVNANGTVVARFNAASLAPGVYTLRLEQGTKAVHHRTVIMR